MRPSNRAVDERGSASLIAAALCAVLVAVTAGAGVLGSAVVARHRAQAAADLAALGAAGHLPAGPAMACDVAGRIARTMGATLTGCTVVDLDVTVRADAQVAGLGSIGGRASATARAGPVDGVGG